MTARVSQLLTIARPGGGIGQEIANTAWRSGWHWNDPCRTLAKAKETCFPIVGVHQEFRTNRRHVMQIGIREGYRNLADLPTTRRNLAQHPTFVDCFDKIKPWPIGDHRLFRSVVACKLRA